MRYAIAVVSCLAATSAHANDLTCKQWFDLGQRSHLSHGESEPMAAIGGQIKGTADTLNAMRMLTARQAQQAAPQHTLTSLNSGTPLLPPVSMKRISPWPTYLPQCGMPLWSLSWRSIALPSNDARVSAPRIDFSQHRMRHWVSTRTLFNI